MQISLDAGTSSYRISGYGVGFITVNEERVERSLLVMPEQLLTDWTPESFEDLRPEHLDAVLSHGPEIVLLGTGAEQHFPDTQVLMPFFNKGIGFEVMDTRAACRTYNILMAEGRRVAAALLMIRP